jgi:hypothetical protein
MNKRVADASDCQASDHRIPPPEKRAEIIIQKGPKNQIPNSIHDAIDARLKGPTLDRARIWSVNTAVIIGKERYKNDVGTACAKISTSDAVNDDIRNPKGGPENRVGQYPSGPFHVGSNVVVNGGLQLPGRST